MAREGIPRKAKDNSRRTGELSRRKAQKRAEAEVRQTAYLNVPLADKLARAGAKEKAKLLSKTQK